MFFAQLLLAVTLLVSRGNSKGDNPIPTIAAFPEITGALYDEKSPKSPANNSDATTERLARVDEASSAAFYSTEFLTTESSSGLTEDQTPGKELQTFSASAGADSTADIGTVSAADYVNTLYDNTSPQSPANSGYPTTDRLARAGETSYAEFYSTEFETTKSTSGLAEGLTPDREFETASDFTKATGTTDIGTISIADYVSTIYYTASPQLPANGDYSTAVGLAQAGDPSSIELLSIKFETTQSASDAAESQTPNRELKTPAASIVDASTTHFGTLSTAEYVNTLHDRTSPQSPVPWEYPMTDRLALANEALSTELRGTAFATTKSTSDLVEGQTPNRELETPLALTEMTSIADIVSLVAAEYINTLYDETSTQSTAPSDYPTTDRLALASKASSVEFYSLAFSATNSTSKLAVGHTANVELETASASTAVGSTADVKIASSVTISSTIYDEMPHQSTPESIYTMMEMIAKNYNASSDELYSTELAFVSQSPHTEPGATSSGEADARSTSKMDNGISFNATEINVGELSSDSALDYSVVGYCVGAFVLLTAVAPAVFILAHSQGLIRHCTGRLTMSPAQSNPA